jgi:hypothetical protein
MSEAAADLAVRLVRAKIKLVAFDFDGVMVPVTAHQNSTRFRGGGQHPVSEGFLALASVLPAVGIKMVIVTKNSEDTIQQVLRFGQPASVTNDPRWALLRGALKHVIGHCARGPGGLRVPGQGRKNGQLRLVSHLAKLEARRVGDPSFEAITAAQVLLIDDHKPNRTAWREVGGWSYAEMDCKTGLGVGGTDRFDLSCLKPGRRIDHQWDAAGEGIGDWDAWVLGTCSEVVLP